MTPIGFPGIMKPAKYGDILSTKDWYVRASVKTRELEAVTYTFRESMIFVMPRIMQQGMMKTRATKSEVSVDTERLAHSFHTGLWVTADVHHGS